MKEMKSQNTHLENGTKVVVYLKEPKERYWGALIKLDGSGVSLKGIDVNSFEDFCRQVAGSDESYMKAGFVYFPEARLEKVILDRPEGDMPSLAERFENITGYSVEDYFKTEDDSKLSRM